MSLDTIALVKLLSLIATAGFTILGILTKDKKEGSLTWGRVSATGAIVSLLLSVVLFSREQRAQAEANARATVEKNQANEKFAGILTRVEENIKGTKETLYQTGLVAVGVKKSVEGQGRVVAQTRTIATNLNRSIAAQGKILKGNELISSDLKDSLDKQRRTIEGLEQVSRDQLASSEKQKEIQVQQGVILQNTLRSITLLNPLAFSFTFSYSLRDSRFAPYVERVKTLAETRFKNEFTYDPTLRISVRRRPDNSLANIEIDDGSPLFPSRNERGEPEVGYELNMAMLNLAFYKDAPSITQPGTANLRIQAVGWSSRSGIPTLGFKPLKTIGKQSSRMELYIDFENQTISQKVFTDAVNRWSEGKTPIISLVDLPNTLLEVTLGANPQQTLESFEILLGENYTRVYAFDPRRFQKEPNDFSVKWYHRFTKEDLRLPY